MVDAGGGSFLRFGEARARLADLSLVAISHLHPDHVADLPALLWLSETARQQPLRIAGPSGAGSFPSFDVFLARLFDQQTGAFPILSGTLGQAGRGVRLDITTVVGAVGTSSSVFADSVVQVTAFGVPHGDVPSIAYKVQVGNRAIVFGSDQNGSDERFSQFASGADMLVLHAGISQLAPDDLTRLHARPATLGQLAGRANARKVVLSHFMEPPPAVRTREWFSLANLDGAVAEIRKHYAGPIEVAADLQCFAVN
jgi:ribonuclease BN (tRNA processing enzyme)